MTCTEKGTCTQFKVEKHLENQKCTKLDEVVSVSQ